MRITFDKVTIHHFLSFGDSQVDLRDRGYCRVRGVNNDPDDGAKSNGSGKSSIWNAISYALTGDTIGGLHSNLPNVAFGDGCWVKLDFEVDGDVFSVTRSTADREFGTNLKVVVNGKDVSGKGIRESEAVLKSMLPDLTSELLGSVILLGQGMPHKFTDNTPAKRKEILENLSKSDYMIGDLKRRVDERAESLSSSKRDAEVRLSSVRGELSALGRRRSSLESELDSMPTTSELEKERDSIGERLSELESAMAGLESERERLGKESSLAIEECERLAKARQNAMDSVNEQHRQALAELASDEGRLRTTMSILSDELEAKRNITDVCPTCGQRIPGVVKPDTSDIEKRISDASNALHELIECREDDERAYGEAVGKIRLEWDGRIESRRKESEAARSESRSIESKAKSMSTESASLSSRLATVNSDISSIESRISRTRSELAELDSDIEGRKLIESELESELADVEKRMDVVGKMTTFLRRDFRGYLLSDVIDYVGGRVTEFASKVFGNGEFQCKLRNNDIEITYCGKDFDNLSGGEKQRADLIIQFAIRDMMKRFLGFSSNILVLDEITDSLDAVSCGKVMDFIATELSEIESVFIISHREELPLPYDTEIIVTKDAKGVSTAI